MISDLLGHRYMDDRFKGDNTPWGEGESMWSRQIANSFQDAGYKSVLEVGAGYGRDSVFFAKSGFNVTAIDHSLKSCEFCVKMAANMDIAALLKGINEKSIADPAQLTILHGDFRDWQDPEHKFDAAIAFKVLHQFRHYQPGRNDKWFRRVSAKSFIDRIAKAVRPGGKIVLATFSENDHNFPAQLSERSDQDCSKAKFIEEGTYDVRGYRPVSFYTESRLRALLSDYSIEEVKEVFVEEDHEPDGKHTHAFWIVEIIRR